MDLNISYEDLLMGDYIAIENVGHIRSPQLNEMRPVSGIGWERYSHYIFFLKMGEDKLESFPDVKRKDGESLFNCIMRNDILRKLFIEAFSFFIYEDLIYDDNGKRILTFRMDSEKNTPEIVGIINADNFDFVRSSILLMNYITLDQTDIQTTYESKAAEQVWKKVQQYQEKLQPEQKDAAMNMGNMLSKLCAIHPSINYLNVFELTVFQFYDAFFQCCYMRSIDFSESIVSVHGSKEFKYDDWLKPVKNY